MFLGCFWAYVGQSHNHIGWATLLPFASINSINPRTNPWNFHEKILRIEKKIFFFASSQWKLVHIYRKARIFWFLAPNNTCLNICNTVYVYFLIIAFIFRYSNAKDFPSNNSSIYVIYFLFLLLGCCTLHSVTYFTRLSHLWYLLP